MQKEIKLNQPPRGRLVEVDGVTYQIINGRLYRYADLTLDKGFKIVFGRMGSEELLMSMLNRLLGLSITRLEYRNTEHPGMTEEERESRFDVYCEDEDGNCFEVEMQNWSQKHFNKRAVYYSSLVVLDQAAKAQRELKSTYNKSKRKWDYDFKPLYVICFLNFKNWTGSNAEERVNEYISTYRYTEIDTGVGLEDGTNLVFIDLYGFNKPIEDCSDLEDIWLYSIKNMLELNACPETARGTEVEELYSRSELAKMTVSQRIKYEESAMTQNDILNSVAEQLEEAREIAIAEGRAEGRAEGHAEGRAEGHAEGLAEGRAEGLAEGMMEERRSSVRKMRTAGFDAQTIASILDLTLEEIENLLQ